MPVTLAELAIHVPLSIPLFEKYGLNYYSKGHQTLSEACRIKGLDFVEIDTELNNLENGDANTRTLSDMDLDRLIDFLNGQYHAEEAWRLLCIHTLIQNLANDLSCGENLLFILNRIEPKFKKLRKQLIQHCKKEDEILFPYMRQLSLMRKYRLEKANPKNISLIKNPIRLLEEEHVQVVNLLSEIRQIANDFKVAPEAYPDYLLLIKNLKEFESDLHMHLHIENNILFPKLIALELELKNKLNNYKL